MQLQAVAPATDTASGGHGVQASAPAVPPLASNCPAAQTQLAALGAPPCSVVWLAPHGTQLAPLSDQEPAAHETHELNETTPRDIEYVPDEQLIH